MTKVLLTEAYLEDIADAIRAKNGTQNTYTPEEMSEAISNLEDVGYYFNTTIGAGTYQSGGYKNVYKNLVPNTVRNTGTSCEYMFDGYTGNNISTLPNFNTTNVTSMNGMFRQCTNLTTLDISNFKTNNVTNVNMMFQNCSNLTQITLPQDFLEIPNYVTANGLFYGCSHLTSVNLEALHTGNITNFGQMFYGCSSLVSLDLSGFDFRKTNNSGYPTAMFSGCTNLESINLNVGANKFPFISYAFVASSLFKGCSKLRAVDLRNFLTDISSAEYLFDGCTLLETINMEGITLNRISGTSTNYGAFRYWFRGCTNLKNLTFGTGLGTGLSSSSTSNCFNIDLTPCTLLTHDSLVDFLTKLADVSDKGAPVAVTTVRLGSTNLAKLTAEEIAIATNKGWTVS